MRLAATLLALSILAPVAHAQAPYKVLQTAKVGGEGGWDYLYADPDGRRLYIPRGAAKATAGSDSNPGTPAVDSRLTVFNLDTLAPIGTIPGVGGNGTAVDPRSSHGFTSDHPAVSMFDTRTMALLKHIDVAPTARPDGILFDAFNQRVYIFSHPTKDATVLDSVTGNVLGTIDLGGTPEQGVADGKGMLYVVMQDAVGSVTAVDVKTMKPTAHYTFTHGDQTEGGCNGLALDVKNSILFAACNRPQPTMVVLSAKTGKILTTLPLAGGSDGATFNPATLEAFSTGGNGTLTIVKETSASTFELEPTLQTMNGARTITFDPKTGHLFTMSQLRGPMPPPPTDGTPVPRYQQGPAIPGSFTILMLGR
jgi:hypothetical protein